MAHKKWFYQALFLFVIMLIIMSCNSRKNSVYFEEIPINYRNNKNKYDIDNTVYRLNKSFLYKFSLIIENKSIDTEVKYIKMNIKGGIEPFSRIDPNYSQTVIEYQYLDNTKSVLFSEKTGLVENKKNIWLHPPRESYAGILQLSAFPFVKFTRAKWKWDLEASYQNYQNVNLVHSYEKFENFDYMNEKFTKIEAETISRFGSSNAKFLFNEKYGFALMEFINIDATKIILELSL